jgi:Flp pilus assembly pilin Flp
MKKTETGQSLVEAAILSALIAAGVVATWSICQETFGKHIQVLLDLIAKPFP